MQLVDVPHEMSAERLLICSDPRVGLRAVVAIDDTTTDFVGRIGQQVTDLLDGARGSGTTPVAAAQALAGQLLDEKRATSSAQPALELGAM